MWSIWSLLVVAAAGVAQMLGLVKAVAAVLAAYLRGFLV
jgi:hypothetical protein